MWDVAARGSETFTFLRMADGVWSTSMDACRASAQRLIHLSLERGALGIDWSPGGQMLALSLSRLEAMDPHPVLAFWSPDRGDLRVTEVYARDIIWLTDQTLVFVSAETSEDPPRLMMARFEPNGETTYEALIEAADHLRLHESHHGHPLYTIDGELRAGEVTLLEGLAREDRAISCGETVVVLSEPLMYAISGSGEILTSKERESGWFVYHSSDDVLIAAGQRMLYLLDPRSLETRETIQMRLDSSRSRSGDEGSDLEVDPGRG